MDVMNQDGGMQGSDASDAYLYVETDRRPCFQGYDNLRRFEAVLETKLTAGTLTEADLDKAVETYFDDRSGPDSSAGFDWMVGMIRREKDGAISAQRLTTIIPSMNAFLLRHLEMFPFTRSALQTPELLTLLVPEERALYVRTAFAKFGAWNTGWVRSALEAGVTRPQLAEAILARLEATVHDRELKYRNTVTYANDFMEYGGGIRPDLFRWRQPEKDSEWSVLTPDQFLRALELCLERSPRNFLKYFDAAEVVLESYGFTDVSKKLILRAANGLEGSIGSDDARKQLDKLSVDERKRVAQQLLQNPDREFSSVLSRFLVQTAVDLETVSPQGAGATWLAGALESLSSTDPVDFYQAAQSVQKKLNWRALPSWLETILSDHLMKGGVMIATVDETENRALGRKQFSVDDGDGRRCIHNERPRFASDWYTPKKGDRVFIYLERAHPILARGTDRHVRADGLWLYRTTFIKV